MRENIVTGKKYRILVDEIANLWDRISFWTKSSDVEFDDGQTLDTKINSLNSNVGNIDQKTSSIASDLVITENQLIQTNQTVTNISGTLWDLQNQVLDDETRLNTHINTKGNSTTFGHVKLRDEYKSLSETGSGIGASHKSVVDCYNSLHDNKVPKSQLRTFVDVSPTVIAEEDFYFYWKDGKYGFYTNPQKIDETFHPFEDVTLGTYSATVEVSSGGSVALHTTNYDYIYVFAMFGVTANESYRTITIPANGGTEVFSQSGYYGPYVFGVWKDIPKGTTFTITGSNSSGSADHLSGKLYGIR